MCTYKSYVSDPTIAEALAARHGVEFCRDLGFPSIVLEGDAQEIVSALGNEAQCLGKYMSLIADARDLLTSFQSWFVSYVRREGNRVVHQLARMAVSHHLHQVCRVVS